ncbi:guanylate cyclase soluble subunit beta-2-like [Babylonia areolata]|uniref:guanylate cyclase soluble subunit beta-2-like n=1 Tax=Babylonia areolata TaxID=304850 RepID=UPI003FD242F0
MTATGLMEAVGRELFYQEATVTVISEAKEGIAENELINHIVMKVDMKAIPGKSPHFAWALGDQDSYHKHVLTSTQCLLGEHSESSSPTCGSETVIRAEDMSLAFPYHMVLDSMLCIRQCGDSIVRMSLVPVQQGTPLSKVGIILQPAIRPTLNSIMQFINSVFVLAIHRKVCEKPLLLKGQMIWMSHCGHLLFVGSPRQSSFDELKDEHMYIADLPLYDVARNLLHLNHYRTAEIEITKKLDATRAQLKEMYSALEEEKQKWQDLLHEMLPPKIARQMLNGEKVVGEKFKSCTLLFSDVVGFTDIASRCQAKNLIYMLNDMYQRFDSYLDRHGVFKVQTIGDAYMAVTAVPEVQGNHAPRMADFAMDIVEEASQVKTASSGEPLKIRVGIHTGPVAAGVVGMKKPRYDLYGVTVSLAARMESTGAPGRIHVSKTTFK